MPADTILAIDLGKYKCVACVYDRATAAAEFRTLTTSRAEVERLIRAARPAVVVIEACSLAGWVHDLCGELRIPCQVANTAAEAWRVDRVRAWRTARRGLGDGRLHQGQAGIDCHDGQDLVRGRPTHRSGRRFTPFHTSTRVVHDSRHVRASNVA